MLEQSCPFVTLLSPLNLRSISTVSHSHQSHHHPLPPCDPSSSGMAPAALLRSGPAQSPCPSCSSASKKWQPWQQPKRLVVSSSSGSAALTRGASSAHGNHGNMDMASAKSSVSLRHLDSGFGGRWRRSGCSGSETRSSCSLRHVFTAAVEGSIAVDETQSSASESVLSVESSEEENNAESVAPSRTKAAERFKPRIPGQKVRREDPTVPAEALVEGAVFTGKVTTISSFGAFVNFGAFTDGLVHISKMSTGYVSNVGDIVKLGQEVKVTILNVEESTGRIALSMVDKEEKEAALKEAAAAKAGEAREGSERSRFQQGPDGKPVNRGRIAGGGRQNRRDEQQRPPTKLTKGQEVEGTVKNKIRSGVFVELPENEEGFLRYSDIPGGENMAPESSLQTGEKVKATVLRIDRGKIVLTMKPIVDISSVNRAINKGKDSGATNPFEIAFRAFNLIPAEPTSPVEEDVAESGEIASPEAAAAVEENIPEAAAVVEEVTAAVEESSVAEEKDVVPDTVVEAPPAQEEIVAEAPAAAVEDFVSEATASAVEEISSIAESFAAVDASTDEIPAESVPETDAAVAEAPIDEEEVSPEVIRQIAALVEDSPAAVVEEAPVAEEQSVPEAAAVPVAEEEVTSEAIPEVAAVIEDSPAAVVEEEALAEKQSVPEAAAPVAAAATPTGEEPVVENVQAGVPAAIVKQLRDETGAGMMDCKRALADTGGDIEKARETLRKKGLASADKKASRIASEGLIGSYIHDSRIGVLLEVNCETDFVSRGPGFKSLVEDLGMQVVASQQVQYVSVEDVPAEVVNKEKELEAQREDLINKPEAIRARIVDGRVSKRLNEFALLEQAYIRDDKILVKDLVKQTVATLGENIKVRRFERYVLGEGLQKKGTDFANEVAAQTAVKAPAEVPKAEEAAPVVEAPKAEEEAPPAPLDTDKAVVVSAALVKDLRDQTGAGMMDCKKALVSTENDLEKAVEFLRKKGLSSADKKASRLASEGLIGTYIHDGRIGILIEVNCETDFVARGEKFKELVDDLAMQIAAYPQVEVVSVDDVPSEVVAKEKELESGKEDLASKPEAIRARIVDGRVTKRLAELALLEQPFIKDDKKLVKDVVKEAIASLGENIQVRRFTRFNLGEGIEKKVVDFASEVAAQSGKTA